MQNKSFSAKFSEILPTRGATDKKEKYLFLRETAKKTLSVLLGVTVLSVAMPEWAHANDPLPNIEIPDTKSQNKIPPLWAQQDLTPRSLPERPGLQPVDRLFPEFDTESSNTTTTESDQPGNGALTEKTNIDPKPLLTRPVAAEENKAMSFVLETDPNGNPVLMARGETTPQSPEKFKKAMKDYAQSRPETIFLSSPGGDFMGGVELGKAIRSAGLNTRVGALSWGNEEAADCASACVYAFMGGIQRTVSKGSRLGLHQMRPESDDISGADIQSAAGVALMHALSMGVGAEAMLAALMIDNGSIYWFTQEDLEETNLVWTGPEAAPPAITKKPPENVAAVKPRRNNTEITLNEDAMDEKTRMMNAEPTTAEIKKVPSNPSLTNEKEKMIGIRKEDILFGGGDRSSILRGGDSGDRLFNNPDFQIASQIDPSDIISDTSRPAISWTMKNQALEGFGAMSARDGGPSSIRLSCQGDSLRLDVVVDGSGMPDGSLGMISVMATLGTNGGALPFSIEEAGVTAFTDERPARLVLSADIPSVAGSIFLDKKAAFFYLDFQTTRESPYRGDLLVQNAMRRLSVHGTLPEPADMKAFARKCKA